LLPGETPQIETVLRAGELVIAVELRKSAMAGRSLYLKVRDRASFEFALVSVAAAIEIEGRTIRAARIALGGVAPRPWRSVEAERQLAGKPATMKNFSAAADSLLEGARALRFNGFKIDMARNAICRALGLLTGVH
jgi:xanthine dehydrogenase YagS FAD-binding subunit